eukprot:7011532-Prymnesium_polylepis.2
MRAPQRHSSRSAHVPQDSYPKFHLGFISSSRSVSQNSNSPNSKSENQTSQSHACPQERHIHYDAFGFKHLNRSTQKRRSRVPSEPTRRIASTACTAFVCVQLKEQLSPHTAQVSMISDTPHGRTETFIV